MPPPTPLITRQCMNCGRIRPREEILDFFWTDKRGRVRQLFICNDAWETCINVAKLAALT